VGARASEWIHLLGNGNRTKRADRVGAGFIPYPLIFRRATTTGAHKGRRYGGFLGDSYHSVHPCSGRPPNEPGQGRRLAQRARKPLLSTPGTGNQEF
jgi:hypothetical protein